MAPNWGLGRTGQLYGAEEATYAAQATFAATDAIRHLNAKLAFNPRNLAKSPERHTTPGQRALYTRRQSGDFDLKVMWYPSGTLNTVPESDKLLKNALGGTPTNGTLSSSVLTAASTPAEAAPTTTAFALTDIGTLTANDIVQIVLSTGANAGTYIRWITTITAAAGTAPKKLITIVPPLPAAPILGDTVKGGVTYKLGTALPKSMDFALYPQAPSSGTPARELLGCVLNKLSFMFDSNLEPMLQISGPAQGFAGTSPNFTPQAQPSGFTTVGAESDVPSGLTGYFQLGTTLYEIEKMQIDIDNAMELQNTALGMNKANGYFRKGKRMVTFKIDAKVSDDKTLWTPSLASSINTMMIQIGTTATRLFGIYMPYAVIVNNTDTGDADETNNWSFQGQALEPSGNDELLLGCA